MTPDGSFVLLHVCVYIRLYITSKYNEQWVSDDKLVNRHKVARMLELVASLRASEGLLLLTRQEYCRCLFLERVRRTSSSKSADVPTCVQYSSYGMTHDTVTMKHCHQCRCLQLLQRRATSSSLNPPHFSFIPKGLRYWGSPEPQTAEPDSFCLAVEPPA